MGGGPGSVQLKFYLFKVCLHLTPSMASGYNIKKEYIGICCFQEGNVCW